MGDLEYTTFLDKKSWIASENEWKAEKQQIS